MPEASRHGQTACWYAASSAARVSHDRTAQALLEGVTASVIEKTEFTMVTKEVKALLTTGKFAERRDVVIVGLECHVCVHQSVLDLVDMGYNVHLCVDAISSQQPADRAVGLHRADRAGAFLTSTESVMMELIKSKDHPQFKNISGLLKTVKFEDPLSFPPVA